MRLRTGMISIAKRSYPTSRSEAGRTPCPKGGSQEELPHVRGQRQQLRVPDCDSSGTTERSYSASEVRGAAERRYPKSEVRGGGQEEIPHAPTPEARGCGREKLPHAPTPEARGSGQEDKPHA